jgi:hypothetical protein
MPTDIYNYITGGHITNSFKNKDNHKALFAIVLIITIIIFIILFPSESKATSKIP